MKLIMLGPQGSGKGTQAKLLSEKFAIPHISTGDIFRENIKNKTELGKKALEYINKGKLVPDELVNEIVSSKIAHLQGFILDGYPRKLSQAEFLESFSNIDYAIEISISDEAAIKRISGRRVCESCGATYSIYDEGYTGKCLKCGSELKIRDDDKEEAVKKRLEIYHTETKPLLGFYSSKGILIKIDGEQPIEKVFEDILCRIRPGS